MKAQILSVLLLIPMLAEANDSIWSTGVEVGAVFTTGNTKSDNVKVKVDSTREGEKYRNNVHFDTLRSSKDSTKTAQKLYGSYQLDFKFDDDRSLFGRVAYEDDLFSGYDYQADLSVGYSQRLIHDEIHSLSADVGVGYRSSGLAGGGDESEGLLRLAGKYTWKISENALFKQLLSTELGSQSNITRSESSLQTTVVGDLAMKLTVAMKHNSDVPAGSKKTDTESSVTLVYQF